MIGKVSLLSGCVLLAPTLASAQDAVSPAAAVEEVIVTANRRPQRLEDVPSTVAVVTSSQIENSGAVDALDLTRLVPALRMERTGPFVQPVIRGVGSFTTGPGQDSNVAIYVDGYYQPFSAGNTFSLANIEAIEVVKGPQGTLFGRNATGGAILITTSRPSAERRGELKLTAAEHNDYRGSLYLTGALAGELKGSLALSARTTDGWSKNIFTGEDDALKQHNYNARASLLYTPTERTELLLALSHGELSDPTGTSFPTLNAQTIGRTVPGSINATRRGEVSSNYPGKNLVFTDAATLTTKQSFEFGSVTSYSGYTHSKAKGSADSDGSSAQVSATISASEEDTYSQELVGSFKFDKLNLITGANYYRDVADREGTISIGRNFVARGGTASIQTTNALGAFVDGAYDVTPRLSVSLGGRLSYERKHLEWFTAPDSEHSWRAFTPRVSARYAISPSTNVYATYSEGFKSGAFNTSQVSPNPVRPEENDLAEVGVKVRQNTWRLNVSAYRSNYKDLQITAYTYPNGLPTTTLVNAASADIKGVEFDASVDPSRKLHLEMSGSYTDARFAAFPDAVGFIFNANGVNTSSPVDATGKRVPRTPRFSATARASYTHDLADYGALVLAVDVYASSRVYFDAPNQTSGAPYAVANLRASWRTEAWEIAAFGTNIFSTKYYDLVIPTGNYTALRYGAPSIFGVDVKRRF